MQIWLRQSWLYFHNFLSLVKELSVGIWDETQRHQIIYSKQNYTCIFITSWAPVSYTVAINSKFYTICHWATIDIHRTINRKPLWNGAQSLVTELSMGMWDETQRHHLNKKLYKISVQKRNKRLSSELINKQLLTLKWYAKLTMKGKEIAWRIFFSFSVCSTCFNFTTCMGKEKQQ